MVTMSRCFGPMVGSRFTFTGGKCQSQTIHLMVMQQREVEELAGGLLFSLGWALNDLVTHTRLWVMC